MAFACSVPAVPTVQRDDQSMRVTRWDFVPGAATGWHVHGWPDMVIYLTDAVIRVHDGAAAIETRLVAGQVYDRPLGVAHDVMNGGDAPMAFVEIEFKRPRGGQS